MSKFGKKTIVAKTISVSILLLGSKFLGIVRELIQVNYLGVGPLSDAFNTAMKIPSLLRKLFAEGALSAAFVPTIIKVTAEESQEEASRLMTLTFALFGIVLLTVCTCIALFPEPCILLIAQGFAKKPLELKMATEIIRILIYFAWFMFSSALLASAMEAKTHFTVPAWGPTLLNLFYIGGMTAGIFFGLPMYVFAYFLLLGGLVQLLIYAWTYFSLHFKILWPTHKTGTFFFEVLIKFFPYVLSVSIIEINLLIDNRFASSLPAGSLSLLSLSSKFMTIALGVFAVAFSKILLPKFSRIVLYAPTRLNFYLLESVKLIFWVTVPIALLMSFFSYSIFYTVFYKFARSVGKSLTIEQVAEAANLLQAFLPGLFFFSVNKMLLNVYYAQHESLYVTIITIVGVVANVLLNRLLMPLYGATGIAIATVLAAMLQTVLLAYVLKALLGRELYLKRFGDFVLRFSLQLVLIGTLFLASFYSLSTAICSYMPRGEEFFLYHIGLWLWVGPLCVLMLGLLYLMSKKGSLQLYFLD